jgi:hypothetical protein
MQINKVVDYMPEWQGGVCNLLTIWCRHFEFRIAGFGKLLIHQFVNFTGFEIRNSNPNSSFKNTYLPYYQTHTPSHTTAYCLLPLLTKTVIVF